MKAAGMRIRIEPELRDAFVAACRRHDLPAAQVIRTFMKGYILQNSGSAALAGKPKKSQAKLAEDN